MATMQDRGLHKTFKGQYVPAQWNGKNEAGWKPINEPFAYAADTATLGVPLLSTLFQPL